MNTIAEILVGRGQKEWTRKDIWQLRLLIPLLGVQIWIVMGVLINIVRPGLMPFLSNIGLSCPFGIALLLLGIRNLPMNLAKAPDPKGHHEPKPVSQSAVASPPKPIVDAPAIIPVEQPHPPIDTSPCAQPRSRIITIMAAFQTLFSGFFVVLALNNRPPFTIWLLIESFGWTLIVFNILSLLRVKWVHQASFIAQIVSGLFIGLAFGQEALKLLVHGRFYVTHLVPTVLLIIILAYFAVYAFILTRPSAKAHFRQDSL